MDYTKRKYKQPSVQEAIFEAKFAYDTFDRAQPGQIFEKIKENYPKKENLNYITVSIGNSNTDLPPQIPVMQAKKHDDSELFQFGPGIIVANRLQYSSWEDFIPAIQLILDAYIETAAPKSLTRIGTRYINSLLIPDINVNITDYFNFELQMPHILHNYQGFELTFINKIDDNMASEKKEFYVKTKFFTDTLPLGKNGVKFILDLDCYSVANFEPNIKEIISTANQQHDILGAIFENIITEKTRDLMGKIMNNTATMSPLKLTQPKRVNTLHEDFSRFYQDDQNTPAYRNIKDEQLSFLTATTLNPNKISDIENIYNNKALLIKRRNDILDNFINYMLPANKKKLRDIDAQIDQLDLQIYLIENTTVLKQSEYNKISLESETRLKKYSSYLHDE